MLRLLLLLVSLLLVLDRDIPGMAVASVNSFASSASTPAVASVPPALLLYDVPAIPAVAGVPSVTSKPTTVTYP